MKVINYLLLTLITFSFIQAMEQSFLEPEQSEEIDLETLQDRSEINALDNQIVDLDKKIQELEPFAFPTVFATLPPEQQIEIKDKARESLIAFQALQNRIIPIIKKSHAIKASQTGTGYAQTMWDRVFPLLELHLGQVRQKMPIVHAILQYSTVAED